MLQRIESWLLNVLRVPPEPAAPFGAPASVRVFRASRKLYYLRLIRWALTQAAALAGLVFWISVVAVSEHEARRVRAESHRANWTANLPSGQNQFTTQPLQYVPPSLFNWLMLFKAAGVAIYVVQLAISFLAVRLDYRFHWYIVTDRSLRIRSGLWNVQELTMSYANLQQVMLSQGPVERILGIANVRVESAGGGSKTQGHQDDKTSGMHSGLFHGVENADEIRDLIIERLRRFRESGLGDPDDLGSHPHGLAIVGTNELQNPLSEAAREFLAEARNLRAALTRR